MNLLRHLRLQIPAAAFSRYGPLVEQIIDDVLDAAARQDRAALVELLHPYLHWTEAGRTIRGRNNVFARLAAGPPPAPPGSYELRDGQIYRWTA